MNEWKVCVKGLIFNIIFVSVVDSFELFFLLEIRIYFLKKVIYSL